MHGTMEKQKIDMFMMMNAKKFPPAALADVKQRLEKLDDDKIYVMESITFWDPTLILIIAIFLGWERFFLDDILLGVLKVLTCYGLGIWWLVDLFTASDRARQYNYKRFVMATSF